MNEINMFDMNWKLRPYIDLDLEEENLFKIDYSSWDTAHR